MMFLEYSNDKRKLIAHNLKEFLRVKKRELPSKLFSDQNIITNLEDFVLRGKLMRGTLFLLGIEMMGKKIDKEMIDIAVGIEIAHSSLLIHDDIIDNDYIRRGEKTIFAKYIERGKEISAIDKIHYGKSIGIVAGDVGFFLAIELFSKLKIKSGLELLRYYANELLVVGLAEGVDSEFGQVKKEATREEILSVYRFKTARYTFSLPLVMAGIVCDLPQETIKILDRFGEYAGIIFQIKDDEIGLFGSEKQIGKPVGSDIRENKKTLIRAILFDTVSNTERKKIYGYFGNPNLSKKQLMDLLSLCNKYKIQEQIATEIEVIMKKTRVLYGKLNLDDEYKSMLKDLLEFNLKRVY